MDETKSNIADSKTANILIIENNLDDYDSLVRTIKQSGVDVNSKRIESKDELLDQFDSGKWQLIISDNSLTNFSPCEALSLIRERDETIPFVVVSGTTDKEEAAVEVIHAGANDYISKNNTTLLVSVITKELRKFVQKKEPSKIEKEFAKIERNYKLLAENVQDLVCVHDHSGECLWISPSAERILGYTSDELKAAGFFKGLHKEDKDSVKENINSLLAKNTQNRIGRFNYRRKRKDGIYIFLETIINGIYEDNSLKKIVSISRDVTEQMMAYQLHEENEARQAGIFESLSEGIILLDEKGNLITYNRSAGKILQIKGKCTIFELLGDGDFITNKANKRLLPQELPYIQTLNSGVAKYNQIIGLKQQDKQFWISMNSVPYYLAGSKKGIVVSFSNVTQQIENQKRIKRFAQELVTLIENANAPIFGIDWEGKISEWNRFTSQITGYSKEEVVDTSLVDRFIPDSHKELVKALFKGVLRGQGAVNYELPIITKKNEIVTILFNGTPRKDYAGKITGMIGVGQDITELIEYRGRLELKVEERTEELTQALEKQKELVSLKSKFVSMASHEFRTPLTTIQFTSDFIRKFYKTSEKSRLEEKFDKITRQVKNMTYLLDDVLTIGKSQARAIKLSPNLIDIAKFCNDIFNELEAGSNDSHKILSSVIVESDTLYLDEKLLRNVLVNLLTNAVKFSPEADKIKVDVTVRLRVLSIIVQDWGNGIDQTAKDKLFEAFHRGSNVGTIEGTGLGLSIVKKAVEILDGRIELESQLNRGTTFKVSIPVKYEKDIGD
ncbi:MAG: PAS domain S-box protein [Bacteroidota bacterium]